MKTGNKNPTAKETAQTVARWAFIDDGLLLQLRSWESAGYTQGVVCPAESTS